MTITIGETYQVDSPTVANTVGNKLALGDPTSGDFSNGKVALTSTDKATDAIRDVNDALKVLDDTVQALEDRVGWIRIVDVTVALPDTVSNKVYEDAPANTIIQSATVSTNAFNVVLEASWPSVEVNSTPATLPLVGTIYRGSVSVTLLADGDVTCEVKSPDAGGPGSIDTVAIGIDAPPALTSLSFTGGYPGSQTELKAGDTFDVAWVADKLTDALQLTDSGAGNGALITFAPALSGTVTVTIPDRGTTAQQLSLIAQARDSVTAALGGTRDTNAGGGGVDGTDVVTLNNLFPAVSIGSATYPGGQGALKGAESATVVVTTSDLDTILFDSPTSELTVTNPTTIETPKTVTRAAGSYNVSVNNFRATANRAANDATTIDQSVVNIANVAATVTVSEATARVRSGPAPGNDTTITIASDQQLLSAPSLEPAVSRGTFQGSWVGGPSTYTRDLRVPDSENPGDGSSNTWINLSATNLAGIVTTTITGDNTYVVGGFTARTINYAAFTANSTETVPVTDESKLTAGLISNGNQSVFQPFGTADTTDVGKEGWVAPTAASGPAVNIRMLHSPSVAANTSGLTLADIEETA